MYTVAITYILLCSSITGSQRGVEPASHLTTRASTLQPLRPSHQREWLGLVPIVPERPCRLRVDSFRVDQTGRGCQI